LAVDLFALTFAITGSVILSVFGFYSIRLLTSLRKGMLEKGWKRVAIGAIFLLLGQFPYLIAEFGPTSYITNLGYLELLLRLIGIVLITLGFKAQYEVWRLDNKDLTPTPVNLSPAIEQ
jgi:hypothetical protein